MYIVYFLYLLYLVRGEPLGNRECDELLVSVQSFSCSDVMVVGR
jgi:hypothetical protein